MLKLTRKLFKTWQLRRRKLKCVLFRKGSSGRSLLFKLKQSCCRILIRKKQFSTNFKSRIWLKFLLWSSFWRSKRLIFSSLKRRKWLKLRGFELNLRTNRSWSNKNYNSKGKFSSFNSKKNAKLQIWTFS